MSTLRRRVVVQGRVQGVAFRASTVDAARAAGVTGWVRNLPDGSVEAVFEGSAERLDQVLAFCRRGPDFARVDRIDVVEEAPEGLGGFAIR